MPNRREFLQSAFSIGAALTLPRVGGASEELSGVEVNDMQSRLNSTRVRRIVRPKKTEDLQAALRQAAQEDVAVSIAGGRHAMGGQQFGRDTILLDM